MITQEVIIKNKMGFHIRPAQLFSEKANQFKSDIKIKTDIGIETDGKSILGLMTLGCEQGSKITITANGEDEDKAIEVLVELVKNGFGEE